MSRLVKVSELFTIKYGNDLELVNLEKCLSTDQGAIPFISRTKKNNGVSAFVYEDPDIETNPPHTLTVALSGSVLSTFYQPVPYYTGFHIFVLQPKHEMTLNEMLFYAKCISLNKYKYSYGRQANKTLKDILIPEKIPQCLNNYLKNFRQVFNKTIDPYQIYDEKLLLNISQWEYFKLDDLFIISGSKTTSIKRLNDYGPGKYPYITTKATDNGTAGFYDYFTETGNVLTVDSAVVGYCSYQALNFSASDHVEKLIPKFTLNKYIALFLVNIINREQYRYNYGIKCSHSRISEQSIKLPAKIGQPDWEFMEKYIKSLPYSRSI